MSDPSENTSPAQGRSQSARWQRWTLVFGLPSAAVALIAAWVIRPHGTTSTVLVILIALAALAVFVTTMPRRQPATAEHTDAGSSTR
ncbi:hypothetical protein ACFWVF_19125 [Streptomyces sp. NPDC058659]|uniref:hypothetical protein n=1 Tax=Streptomyces sp. NPDC058659 TaxID=3346581 RepID=UPI00364D39FC